MKKTLKLARPLTKYRLSFRFNNSKNSIGKKFESKIGKYLRRIGAFIPAKNKLYFRITGDAQLAALHWHTNSISRKSDISIHCDTKGTKLIFNRDYLVIYFIQNARSEDFQHASRNAGNRHCGSPGWTDLHASEDPSLGRMGGDLLAQQTSYAWTQRYVL